MIENQITDMNAPDKPNLQDLRVSYELDALDESSAPSDPFILFHDWLHDALQHQLPEPNAMTLATIGQGGIPTARIVLLKGLDDRGFHFYTNYQSRKGQELAENNRAAICFLWTARQRQVTARGLVWKLPHDEAASYFAARPRSHQIGAWASAQSQIIPDRFTYRQGATYVGSTTQDLVDAGAGVCQDFVHLALILLRRQGIAARYVSGYHTAAPQDGGSDSVGT